MAEYCESRCKLVLYLVEMLCWKGKVFLPSRDTSYSLKTSERKIYTEKLALKLSKEYLIYVHCNVESIPLACGDGCVFMKRKQSP